ncbi:BTAD domain-containing putative transcriptional regulator [Streptosporangium vulgare]|uniref:BTAD domain-containing putative transcriptional regulator n=1 Tax=Streptosporangium vulgare TaxID=46190 RepID=A0ABV5TK77_9ACTN
MHDGETSLPLAPGRQPIILGALLLEVNRTVSTEHLIDAVWDDDPPPSARGQVQICISALRRLLALLPVGAEIIRRAPGYLLRMSPEDLDHYCFEQMVQDAQQLVQKNDAITAAATLRRALSLWRGKALGGVVSRLLESKALRLDESRLAAQETCIDLELSVGRHHELIGELTDLVERNPLRERLRGQLMLALHRSGRQAEALEVYRAGRAHLIDELGLEPAEELRKLESAILLGDDSLMLDTPSPVAQATAALAGTSPMPLTVTPHQLPADTHDFTGRRDLVGKAEEFLRTGDAAAVRIVVLSGKPGVGKSCLAVHVAHRLASDFADGQLYRDLRSSQLEAMPLADTLGTFLRSLGIPGPAVPSEADERISMYRSLLADRRMLVVLEDVAGENQVMPLLPGSAGCSVIITSRSRLTGLPGALQLDVDVMDQEQSLELIGKVIGADRVAAEPEAAVALTKVVGGLPLALRILAARLAARPHWSLASMVGRLSDEWHRLDELAYGEMIVRQSLSLTYDGMDDTTRRVFRLLGLAEVEAIPAWLAAVLLDGDVQRSMDRLEQLVDDQMLDVSGVDAGGDPRYRFHGLIRVFARERLHERETRETMLAVLGRVVGCWLDIAAEAHRRLHGGDYTVLHGSAPRWKLPQEHLDRLLASPLNWLDSERANLCAAVLQAGEHGMDEACWDLAVTLVTLFETRSYFEDWQRTHEQALGAARNAGNRRGMAALMCSLGSMHLNQRRPSLALPLLESARTHFHEIGEIHGGALAARNLAMLHYRQGALEKAAGLYDTALTGFGEVGDLVGEAHVLANTAQIELDRREYGEAESRLDRALKIAERTGSTRVQAQVLHKLGKVHLLNEDFERAEQMERAVLRMVRDNSDVIGESYALHNLGLVYGRRGSFDLSERTLRQALEIRESVMDHLGASQVRLDLAEVLAARGDVVQAVEIAEKALAMFQERQAEQWSRRADEILAALLDRR